MRLLFFAAMLAATLAPPVSAQAFRPGVNVTDDNPYPVKTGAPLRSVSAVTNGTITAANTYQSVLAASATRNGCTVQNKSGAAMRVFLGAPGGATDARAFDLAAGGLFSCTVGSLVLTDEISLASGTAGSAYLVSRQ